MCTLIVLHRCLDGVPLLVAANRDEYLDRPAEPPCLRRVAGRTLLAPRDLRAGGTWLGLNDAGLFVALTNRPAAARDDLRRSRGLLVDDALGAGSLAEAADLAAALPVAAYNPFNLFATDGRDAFVAVYDDEPRLLALDRGVHVIGNADPDDRSVPKVARLLDEAARVVGSDQPLDRLAAICRRHDAGDSPLADTCIHAGGYGTRSSLLLSRSADGDSELLFSDGAPCEAPYEDLTPLLRELDRKAGVAAGIAQRKVA